MAINRWQFDNKEIQTNDPSLTNAYCKRFERLDENHLVEISNSNNFFKLNLKYNCKILITVFVTLLYYSFFFIYIEVLLPLITRQQLTLVGSTSGVGFWITFYTEFIVISIGKKWFSHTVKTTSVSTTFYSFGRSKVMNVVCIPFFSFFSVVLTERRLKHYAQHDKNIRGM